MNRFREYFIGGPLDGKDKLTEYPDAPDWSTIRSVDFTGDAIVTHEGNTIRELNIEWNYTQDHFMFGGTRVQFWTDHRMISKEVITFRLAELIMEPHQVPNTESNPQTETERESA